MLLQVDTLDDALELVNANPYGNGTAIFTDSGSAARKFQHDVQVRGKHMFYEELSRSQLPYFVFWCSEVTLEGLRGGVQSQSHQALFCIHLLSSALLPCGQMNVA